QETSIFRGMTVQENILAVLEAAEPDKALRFARLEQLLGEFGLTALRDSPAMALSGGERRRCEIARALAAKPSIMLLDEPFAGIDPISIADIRQLVRTPQLRQAIQLLQLSNLELDAFLAEELSKNPLLEARPEEGGEEQPAGDFGSEDADGEEAPEEPGADELILGQADDDRPLD